MTAFTASYSLEKIAIMMLFTFLITNRLLNLIAWMDVMASSDHPQDNTNLLSLLENAIEFAVYHLAVDPGSPYGGRVEMVSPSMKEIVGAEDPFKFETWFTWLHPDDVPRITAANERSWKLKVGYNESARFFNQNKGRWSWVHTISTPVFDDNGNLTHFSGVVIDITEQKKTEQELQRRKALEDLILSLSTRFINLPTDAIDEEIETALKAVGEFTEVDRAYLLTFSEQSGTFSCIHEWRRDRIQPKMQHIAASALRWSRDILLSGKILHIPRVADLPWEALNEQEAFQLQGIRSLLVVPMFFQNKGVGLLGFDAVREEKNWPQEIQKLLQVVSSIFVNAMEYQRSQDALNKAHAELEQRVTERTQALQQANETLRREMAQRQLAEESIQICEALYLEVFDNSPLQLFVQEVLPDGHFRVLRTNPAHQNHSGMSPEKIWGKTVEELVIPEVAETINRHYRDCIATGEPIEYEESGPTPYWNLSRIRNYRTTIAPVRDSQGKIVRLVGASQDITDQKLAEEILMDRARDEAVSSERSRLARELHDAVTQTLFSTTLTAEVLPRIWERNPEEGRKKLEELRELTRGALAEMRTLLMELRPDALADADLTDLLRHLGNAFIARARIPIQMDLDKPSSLPLEVKVAFYRIAQETLNNIAKHSEASQVQLTLKTSEDEVLLAIVDDGVGFDAGGKAMAGHYGLGIMHERAEQIGAAFEVNSHTGQGTQVQLRWQPGQTTQGEIAQDKQ